MPATRRAGFFYLTLFFFCSEILIITTLNFCSYLEARSLAGGKMRNISFLTAGMLISAVVAVLLFFVWRQIWLAAIIWGVAAGFITFGFLLSFTAADEQVQRFRRRSLVFGLTLFVASLLVLVAQATKIIANTYEPVFWSLFCSALIIMTLAFGGSLTSFMDKVASEELRRRGE